MKPDWKDAPEWANWLVLHDDLWWCWHQFKPRKSSVGYVSNGNFARAKKMAAIERLEARP